MEKELEQLVRYTVEASHLSDDETLELKRELMSHVEDQADELRLQGKRAEEVIAYIEGAFGSPEDIGKGFFVVYRELERIPWIGPFFYYTPLRQGMKLLALNLFYGIVMTIIIGALLIFLVDPLSTDDALDWWFIGLCGLVSATNIFYGYRIARKRWDAVGESMLIGYLPFLLIGFLQVLNIMLNLWFNDKNIIVITTDPLDAGWWDYFWYFYILILTALHFLLVRFGMGLHYVIDKLKRCYEK